MSPSTVPLVGVRGVTRVSEGHLPLLDQGGQVVGPRRGRRSTGELAELGQAQRTTLAEPQQRLSHHVGRHAALSLEWGGDGLQRWLPLRHERRRCARSSGRYARSLGSCARSWSRQWRQGVSLIAIEFVPKIFHVVPSNGIEGWAMSTVSERVLEETKRFRAALPGLLETHRGKWVVFKDGAVRGIHDDEKAAYEAAVKEFGSGAGYVIAPVTETHPTPVTAAVLFGLTHA